MRHFCTLFDRNYIARGLALHRSLVRHCGDFMLHVLCLDAPTLHVLRAVALPQTELITIEALEHGDQDLRGARNDRTQLEFYFTCKPVLLGYVLDHDASVSRLEYLDADLYFFSDLSDAEKEYAESAVALSPHRFNTLNAGRARYGGFNAGWISVSADLEGRRFIGWWRDRCVEWCRLAVEDTRFGDQKYLDQVPALFRRTTIVSHPGINLAPWNIGGCRVDLSDEGVEIEGHPVVSFHFHGTKRMLFNLYESGLHDYGVKLTSAIRRGIYQPYATQLAVCNRQLLDLPAAVRAHLDAASVAPSVLDLARQFTSTVRGIARHTTVFAAA
jgi:hypothetical protein